MSQINTFTIGAVIPVQSYGNLQPSITVEAKDFTEAKAKIMPEIEKLWLEYGEKPLTAKIETLAADVERLTGFVGGEIDYSDSSHTYTWDDITYLSGSQYAAKFKKPFNAQAITQAMAKKSDVKAQDILDMWELKKDTSLSFGTAIHNAIELYGRFKSLAEAMDKTYHLHDHPVIKKAVEDFYAVHSNENVVFEAVVINHDKRWVGRIDRILITGDKKCRVQDMKTSPDISKDIDNYWHQLNFYGQILTDHGWTVEGLDILAYSDKWETISNKFKGVTSE